MPADFGGMNARRDEHDGLAVAQRIRRLGIVAVVMGVFLVGMMAVITAVVAPIMLSAGTNTNGARFEGTPEQGLLIMG